MNRVGILCGSAVVAGSAVTLFNKEKPAPQIQANPFEIIHKAAQSQSVAIPQTKEWNARYSHAIPHDNSYYLKCMLGGVLSCGITHTAVCPLDVTKCNMQVGCDVPICSCFSIINLGNKQ
jgi:hypothetical protein